MAFRALSCASYSAVSHAARTTPHRLASTLIVSEPLTYTNDETVLHIPPSTLSMMTAAQTLHDGPISLLLVSTSSTVVTLTASNFDTIPKGLHSILHSNASTNASTTSTSKNNALLPENMATLIRTAIETNEGEDYTHVIAAASKFGSSFLPRASALLNVSPVMDVVEILAEDTFIRPMYAGNALAKVKSNTPNNKPHFLTIRPTAFDKCDKIPFQTDSNEPNTTHLTELKSSSPYSEKTQWISENKSQTDRPELGSASIVISGGRGMKNGENFQLLETLADQFQSDGNPGAAVGASRAAVDAGFVPNDLQVGQTGKVVAPDLYIAVGISGAIQHLSGMKDSKTIVAINNDPDAPIFQVADYGLEADLFDAIPELTEKLGE